MFTQRLASQEFVAIAGLKNAGLLQLQNVFCVGSSQNVKTRKSAKPYDDSGNLTTGGTRIREYNRLDQDANYLCQYDYQGNLGK